MATAISHDPTLFSSPANFLSGTMSAPALPALPTRVVDNVRHELGRRADIWQARHALETGADLEIGSVARPYDPTRDDELRDVLVRLANGGDARHLAIGRTIRIVITTVTLTEDLTLLTRLDQDHVVMIELRPTRLTHPVLTAIAQICATGLQVLVRLDESVMSKGNRLESIFAIMRRAGVDDLDIQTASQQTQRRIAALRLSHEFPRVRTGRG
ncbi:MAG: hypothetical protein AAGD38_21135 [Acidobacteriota bacterium]